MRQSPPEGGHAGDVRGQDRVGVELGKHDIEEIMNECIG